MSARAWTILGVAVLLGGLGWANARLVLLAVESQPECVAHERGETPGVHRAARSSC